MLLFVRSDGNELDIFVDDEGQAALRSYLDQLLRGETHVHLFTPSWGGTELSEDAVIPDKVIHKVNIVTWGVG
jgi:hypothetical protein